MKKNLFKQLFLVAIAVTVHFLASDAKAQILFSDNFETNSAAQWAIFGGGNGGVTNDYSVQFNYNYRAQTYRFNGQILPIPSAPNSGGTSNGVKVTANKNRPANPRIAAVSLYPIGKTFSNNYALRFDMFMDYNGDVAGGGSGSTEFATFGINHTANEVNWISSSASFIPASWPSDGVWFTVDGEGGTTIDYAAYVGDPTPGPAIAIAGPSGGFLYDQNVDYNNYTAPIATVLPAPPGQSPGAPGKQWVQVEIQQRDGFVTWLMNGYVIASHNFLNGYTNGDIMIGYSDPINGIPNPPNENYVIFDNVRVVALGTNFVPTVRLTPIDLSAAEPSFSIDRVDKDGNPAPDVSTPLTVNLRYGGTASNGVDYVALPASITLPAGVQSTNIIIMPINSIGQPTKTITVRLLGSTNYEIRTSFTLDFTLRGLRSANFEALKPIAYENLRSGKINLYLSEIPVSDVTVNYTISGTATNGVDYVTLPTSRVITNGTTNVVISIVPINNSLLDTNRTVILTIAPGGGYAIGSSSNATVTIRNDDLPPGTILFSDNFDSDSSLNWNINKSQPSDLVTFAYDYSADGIPPAPNATNGTTKGVKLEANVTANVPAGISLSPKNGNYTGDYRLKFDAWINYPGPLAGGGPDSTEWLSAGVGTTGDHPNWAAPGADGIWFDTVGDGSSTIAADFEAFKGTTSLVLGATNVWVGNSQASASPYYAEFGNDSAPQVQIDNVLGADQTGITFRGALGFAWHDMVITKQGTNVTWSVDGLPFAKVPTNGITLSSNVFIGYYDATTNLNAFPQFAFVIFDNVRVESLSAQPSAPRITSIQIVGGNVQIDFTGSASDSPSSFALQSANVVTGPYTDVAPAATLSPGVFRATKATSGSLQFYRIRR
ncbi:MAG: hypothetical protein M3Y82_01555 [Verrucomicrobiota bacterium]|nr:hypothetical protein [Verrucomicrobiota bacterium]